MTLSHLLRIVRASLFASFGAGIGIALLFSLFILSAILWEPGILVFDCSTLQDCGLTAANTLLAAILFLVGSAAIMIFASIVGAIYALPVVFILGAILYCIAMQKGPFDNRLLVYLFGAVGGASWWVILAYFNLIPFFPRADVGAELTNVPYIGAGLTAPVIGGMISAEMFLRWLRTELD